MTDGDHFTISKSDSKKVKEAFDKWKHRKLSKSQKICQAIIKLHEEEERGSKITAFNGQQSKLPLLPPVYEVPKMSDLDGLTYDEIRTLKFAAMEWVRLADKSIIEIQRQK